VVLSLAREDVMLVIREVNLATGEAHDYASSLTRIEAEATLDMLRKKRGHWKQDPVVHAIVDPETKIEHVKNDHLLIQWMKKMVTRRREVAA
jgi:hypothetical protein